ncbi:hypothetical protein ACN6LA_006480 [Streptomyces sp. SAS_269]|uniref:hypothetical protein n=1 Tax=Streptomyces sp. SAS_269 TaxID=3412749 RepID=UPI00403C4072
MSDDLIVVLADPGDEGACAVVSRLTMRRRAEQVVVVRSHELARSRWHHTVDPHGVTATRITLPDGRVMDGGHIAALLHRLPYVPPLGFVTASAKDRHYAYCELRALVASWLLGLASRVVGRPMTNAGLSQPSSPWLGPACARQSGLPVARWPGSAPDGPPRTPPVPAQRLLVAGERVVGELGSTCAQSCRALLGLLGTNLAELHLVRQNGPALVGVDMFPPLDLPVHREAVTSLLIDIAERHPGGRGA